MSPLARWFAPAALAAALGASVLLPSTARADDDLVRVLVDVADVVIRGGHPYYRYGDYGYRDRLIVRRDRYGRPIYYRMIPRNEDRYGPPYGNAYGYRRHHDDRRYSRQRCDSRGRCRVEYYDPRYDDRDDWRDDRRSHRSRYDHDNWRRRHED
ncbi:MAG: hypothetical protein E6Q88_11915 [Lysobacteraceae bacterium]|nr:MAG: hypothetical protein E6Q88_11915 [Xanthomonadaceae bacterium]